MQQNVGSWGKSGSGKRTLDMTRLTLTGTQFTCADEHLRRSFVAPSDQADGEHSRIERLHRSDQFGGEIATPCRVAMLTI